MSRTKNEYETQQPERSQKSASVAFDRLAQLLQTRQVRLMNAENTLQFAHRTSSKKGCHKGMSAPSAAAVQTEAEKNTAYLGDAMTQKPWRGYVMRHTVNDLKE